MSDQSKIERKLLENYTDEDRRRDIARLLDAPTPPRSDEPEDFEQNGMLLMQREFMKVRAKMLERERNQECEIPARPGQGTKPTTRR
jgi:hypothetical protein